jgi:hypothetical protein
MPNDEIRMTKQIRMTNDDAPFNRSWLTSGMSSADIVAQFTGTPANPATGTRRSSFGFRH